MDDSDRHSAAHEKILGNMTASLVVVEAEVEVESKR